MGRQKKNRQAAERWRAEQCALREEEEGSRKVALVQVEFAFDVEGAQVDAVIAARLVKAASVMGAVSYELTDTHYFEDDVASS